MEAKILTDEQRAKACEEIRARIMGARGQVVMTLPNGRGVACVLTKLDEAAMWLDAVAKGETPIKGAV